MKALIDSDILIDFLQGIEAAAVEIDRYDDACYSIISWKASASLSQRDRRMATHSECDDRRSPHPAVAPAERSVPHAASPQLGFAPWRRGPSGLCCPFSEFAHAFSCQPPRFLVRRLCHLSAAGVCLGCAARAPAKEHAP